MKTVTIEDAKQQLAELIDDVNAGEEIIISDQGEPVAKITSVQTTAASPRKLNAFAQWLLENPIPEGQGRSSEDVARQIAEERDSWEDRPNGPAIVKWIEDHPIPEGLRRSPEEIERSIQEERNSWD